MRVATRTLFNSSVYRINSNLSDLNKASTVVSTGKKINAASDDPTGYAGILGIHSTTSSLTQIQRNITTGQSWLSNTETILGTVQDDILEARDACIQLGTDSYSEDERAAVAEQINDILLNVNDLSATRIDGAYLFSGTATDTRPFVFDNDNWPTSVSYQGNDSSFAVETGHQLYSDVSITGDKVFTQDTLWVDEMNNVIDFLENTGTAQLTATIPEGKYTKAELAEIMEDVMEVASQAAYRVTGITNSTGIDTAITLDDYSKLTGASVGSLQLDWDGNTWNLSASGGYTSAVVLAGDDQSCVEIDLDGDASGDIRIDLSSAMTPGSITFDVTAGTAVDYDVTYDSTTDAFSFSDAGGTLTDLSLLWESGTGSGQSIALDIGFGTDVSGATTYTGDADVTWGIFETLIDLRDALAGNDTDGISRAITRLNSHYDHFSTQVSLAGIKSNVLETRESIINTLVLNLETREAENEDADMVKAIADLSARQTAYEASLSAYTQIVAVSILDYI